MFQSYMLWLELLVIMSHSLFFLVYIGIRKGKECLFSSLLISVSIDIALVMFVNPSQCDE